MDIEDPYYRGLDDYLCFCLDIRLVPVTVCIKQHLWPWKQALWSNVGALINRLGFGVHYTIIIIRNTAKPYSTYEGPYIRGWGNMQHPCKVSLVAPSGRAQVCRLYGKASQQV